MCFPPNRGGLLLGRGRLVGGWFGQVLVVDWAQHMGGAVPSAVVVEVVAPGQHDGPGTIRIEQLVAGQDLPFQAGEERLRRGVCTPSRVDFFASSELVSRLLWLKPLVGRHFASTLRYRGRRILRSLVTQSGPQAQILRRGWDME